LVVKVGIIGGTGRMGGFFAPVFERHGHEVMVSGRTTTVTGRDLARSCDLVIVSVPIRDTVRVIGEVAPLMGGDQVLADFTSVKEGPVQAMLASRSHVLGMHPMFGPSVPSLRDQTVIITPARCDARRVQWILDLLKEEGATVTTTTPEEHDRMMAVVQGLIHFVTLMVAETVRRTGIDPLSTLPFTSPVYRMEMGLVGRLLSQDPSLYADILIENRHVGDVIMAGSEAWSRLAACVHEKDSAGFEEMFRADTAYFGRYCEEGRNLTDNIIRWMVGQ
jgi:prephenate dehydrogenase